MARWSKSKKNIILRALKDGNPVPVDKIAKELYGVDGMLGQIKVVNLLSAYRVHDIRFKNIRVRNKHICFINATLD
ncbi:hypothetical protein [Desulfotomaculum nigrificans]|uniref:hypothetical protein n=1 Tax=Desulfotomaculum nigrificans TaxID=1565 RepID=UPI0001FAE7CE|nr:hypothetical protein [Desulfotomaculum nigrificans]